MDESKTKVLIAVAPDAPEWMRKCAKTMAEEYGGAKGAIMTICRENSQVLMIEHVNCSDILHALGNLCGTIREQFPADLAEALIQQAIREETEEKA